MRPFTQMVACLAIGFIVFNLLHSLGSREGVASPSPLIADVRNVQRSQLSQYEMEVGGEGYWVWDPRGAYVSDIVVVMTAGGWDPTMELVQNGFLVWRRHTGCGHNGCETYSFDASKKSTWGKRFLKHGWDFLGYLGDDRGRPEAGVVVFLTNSGLPDTKNLTKMILKTAQCAKKANRYTPLRTDEAADLVTETAAENPQIFSYWNKNIGTKTAGDNTIKATSRYDSVGFAVPRRLLRIRTHEFFQNLAKKVPEEKGDEGLTWQILKEFLHVIFGETPTKPYGYPGCKKITDWEQQPVVSPGFGRYKTAVNEIGNWAWDPKGAYVDKILIVVGGGTANPTAELVSRGFKVWRSNKNCKKEIVKAGLSLKLTMDVCTESYGYLQYLRDGDEGKPVADFIVFIHGHFESWHQPGDLAEIILNAVQCAEATGTYTPLTKYDLTKYWHNDWEWDGRPQKWIKFWNHHLGRFKKITGPRLSGWACGSFILPKHIPASAPSNFYQTLFDVKMSHPEEIDGFFFEYTFHVIFGEPEMVDITRGIPQCPNFTLADEDPKFKRQKKARYERLERIHKEREEEGGYTTKLYLPLATPP